VALVGTRRKLESRECDRGYPAEIEFRDATFLARKGPGQGFIVWDAGGYEVVEPGTVKIDTASDEQVRYRFALTDDVLTFVDSAGCQFRYRRLA
jgi:hypothetical protein